MSERQHPIPGGPAPQVPPVAPSARSSSISGKTHVLLALVAAAIASLLTVVVSDLKTPSIAWAQSGGTVSGPAPVGSTITVNTLRPVPIAAVDSASKIRRFLSDGNGVLFDSFSLAFQADFTSIVKIAPTASNGTTNVTLVSGVASQRVYALTLVFYNTDTVAHTVDLCDGSSTNLLEFALGAGSGAFALDGRGDVYTGVAAALTFKIDAGGTGNTVKCSGSVIQK